MNPIQRFFTIRLRKEHHVLRYCPRNTFEGDAIGAQAFMPRKNEKGLSVNWIEYFLGNLCEQVKKTIKITAIKLRVHKKDKFALLNIEETKNSVLKLNNSKNLLQFKRSPCFIKRSPFIDWSHSEISGYSYQDLRIAACISQTIKEQYPAN